MAQVPYNPIPQTKPTEAGTPEVQVQTSITAFGGTVAQALEGFGRHAEHAGDEIFRQAIVLQNQANETEAKNADSWYMEEAGKLHAQFNSLEGNDAVKAYPKYIKDLDETRTSIRKGLSNDMVRKMYDGPSLSFYGRSVFNGAGVAASQAKHAANQASAARMETIANAAGANPQDEIGFLRGLTATEDEARQTSARQGASPEVVQNNVQKAASHLKASRITGLARTAPMDAIQMLKDYGPDLTVADRERAESVVYGRASSVVARVESDRIIGDAKEGAPLKELLDAAGAKVEGMKFEDPALKAQIKNNLEAAVIAKFHRQEAERRDMDNRNIQTVVDGLNGAYSKSGEIPVSMDQLLTSDPKVQESYDALKPTDKRKVTNMVANAARNGNKVDNATSWSNMQRLYGMAKNDETREEFLKIDPYDPKYKINNSDWRQLLKLRQQIITAPGKDPHVNSAMTLAKQYFQPEMTALKIMTRADNPEIYDKFMGSLAMALEDFQTRHKQAPGLKDKKEMIGDLLKQVSTPGIVFGDWWPNKKRWFQQEPADTDWKDQFKTNWEKRRGETPTDDQMARAWLQKRWQEMHGGSVATEEEK